MGLFKSIADKFAKLTGTGQGNDLKELAAQTRYTGEALLRFLNTKELRKKFVEGLQIGHRGKFDYLSGAIYNDYVKHIGHKGQIQERRVPLSSWISVIEQSCADLNFISNNLDYSDWDNGENIRISSVVIDGYVGMAMDFYQWIFYLLATSIYYRPNMQKFIMPKNVVEEGNLLSHGAPYMAHKAKAMSKDAFAFAKGVLDRHAKHGLIEQIKTMKTAGRDVLLKTADHGLDVYANEKDYTKDEIEYAEFGFRNPIAALGAGKLVKAKELYDRNKATRDWLAACVARSSLDAQRHPVGSPEYKKAERLAQSYLDLVSEYDKKLKAYHEEI